MSLPSPQPAKTNMSPEEAIVAYKQLLQTVLNQRPSGTRQRLADALGKNRSFITQMTSPSYPTPVPHRHVGTVLAVCHFTPEEREAFMAAYRQAHRKRFEIERTSHKARHLNLVVPDLGDDKRNAAFDKAVIEFIHKMAAFMEAPGEND
jgi:uncharacterized membrane protein